MGLADIETDQVRTPGPEPDTASFGMRGTQSVGVKQRETDARIKLRHKIPMHRLMNILIRFALCHGMEVFVASESATAAAAASLPTSTTPGDRRVPEERSSTYAGTVYQSGMDSTMTTMKKTKT